jgi:para-nitrobenzyl esterase
LANRAGGGKVTCMLNAPSAKGLFHKAIVESAGSGASFGDKAISQKVAAVLLAELKLAPSQIDSLQKIPYDRLNAASKVAMRKVAAEARATGGRGGGWGPVFDGYFFPNQPSEQQARELSKNIPLMVGTTKNEMTPFTPDSVELTMDMVKAHLQKQYGDKADAYIAAVKKAYPGISKPTNFVDIDLRTRPGQ